MLTASLVGGTLCVSQDASAKQRVTADKAKQAADQAVNREASKLTRANTEVTNAQKKVKDENELCDPKKHTPPEDCDDRKKQAQDALDIANEKKIQEQAVHDGLQEAQATAQTRLNNAIKCQQLCDTYPCLLASR